MMLSKPFVSLIATIAAASTVAAAATPVARGDYWPPPTVPSVSQCNTGTVQCCNTMASAADPLVGSLGGLLGLVPNLALPVGLSCTSIGLLNSNQCNNSPVCCSNVYQRLHLSCLFQFRLANASPAHRGSHRHWLQPDQHRFVTR
ncbi:hypothetical protein BC826DRAFT_372308 [Russula brevipes]|nr:hypothetical protein BC826DRAFT_372308 [Russula brevipes]